MEDIEYNVVPDFMMNRLPTEMLLKIMSYLPTRDKITMRYVSRRLRHVSQTPLLWKELVWHDYEPRHVGQVSDTLRTCGEHVTRILFPAHVCTTPIKVLEMARCCTKVIHLSLSNPSKFSLDCIEEILCIMPHLQQLDLCIDGRYMVCTRYTLRDNYFFEGLLKVTAARVRKLKLQINRYDNSVYTITKLQRWANEGNPLPLLIDIFTAEHKWVIIKFLEFWSESSSKLLSCEISLYSNKRVPMNLYPPMPICTLQSGPDATPIIRLSNHGIMGLGIFYIGKYDHNGAVRYTISPAGSVLRKDPYGAVTRVPHPAFNLVNKLFYYSSMDILHAVSYVDMSYSKVWCHNLEQLAIVCPNLQRLNLNGNGECLVRLRGLNSIVHVCQNLEGLNLAGIQLLSVKSSSGLWEIISSIKKLTHLAIDLCMLTSYDNDHKRCLVNMFKRCHSLKALELYCGVGCSKCINTKDFLFSHFPSLTHCRMSNFVYSGFKYAITNCHKLKYLYETNAFEELDEKLSPFTCICHLQQLYIDAAYFNVTDELSCALSAHGGLECVILHVNSITIDSIIILIKYSPNLVLLKVASEQILFDENCKQEHLDYTDYIMKKFSYHKLFAIGSFTVCSTAGNSSAYLFNTVVLQCVVQLVTHQLIYLIQTSIHCGSE